jgi:hypothetical protein
MVECKMQKIMIKKLLYAAYALMVIFSMSACSDDSVSPDDSLTETRYDAEKDSTAGSVGEAINNFYNKYGSKILYNFSSTELAFGWSSVYPKWYAPVKAGNDANIIKLIKYLEDKVCTQYPTDFIKKYLPFRIFLVDSICDNKTYNAYDLKDILELKTHGVVISHVGSALESYSDADWDVIGNGMITAIMDAIYSKTSVPTAFTDLRPSTFLWIESDPQGEFSDFDYTVYSNNLVNGSKEGLDWGLIIRPSDAGDLGYYISFVTTTPKAKMDKIFARFPKVRTRAQLIATFIKEQLEMDPVAMQNASCPSDPVPADYWVTQ